MALGLYFSPSFDLIIFISTYSAISLPVFFKRFRCFYVPVFERCYGNKRMLLVCSRVPGQLL